MRTTLDIDEDILGAAKELAQQQKTSAGKVISDLARKGLAPKRTPKFRNGVQLLERRAGSPIMTMAMVNRLRDGE